MSRIAGHLRQIGVIVPDIDRAILHWTRNLGVGPFLLIPEVRFENYRYRGKAMPGPKVSLAFAQSGPLQIELIQQHDRVPSAYLEFLEVSKGGVQHLCAWADSSVEYERLHAKLRDQGFQEIHQGNVEGAEGRFCYFGGDGNANDPLLEISEGNLPDIRPLWERLQQRADRWDGTHPLINLADLAG